MRQPHDKRMQQPWIGALLATLNEALSDMSRLRKMGESSFRIVEQEINLEKMVEVFVEALNFVV